MPRISDSRFSARLGRPVLTCVALCLMIAGSIADAQTMRPVSVTVQRCQGATCHVTEGLQPGLTIIDISGSAPSFGGSTIRLNIIPSPGSEFNSRAVGVMSNGKFTASIPAYRFAVDEYTWSLNASRTSSPIAQGAFSVVARGRPSAKAADKGTGTPAGTWYGINGTAGTVELLQGGSYKYAGKVAGHYTVSGETMTFTGTLGSWNNGHAKYDGRTIEFEWTRSDGGKNYFVFAK